MLDCSAGKFKWGSGFISVDLATFLKPGFKRGQFRDSFDATYNPQRQSISGRLVIPPDPVEKTCDAQMIPFEVRFVGYGPDTFMKTAIESYRKAGLYTETSRETEVKGMIQRSIGNLPTQALQ